MKLNKLAIIILIFLLNNVYVFSQKTDIEIKENYNGISINEFISKVKELYKIKIYFDKNQTKDIIVIQKNTHENLSSILNNSFEGKSISNYIDLKNNVFITKNYKIVVPNIEAQGNSNLNDFNDVSFYKIENEKKTNNGESNIVNIGNQNSGNKTDYVEIYGNVREKETGLAIIGAIVAIKSTTKATSTDVDGYYILKIPYGVNKIFVSGTGCEERILEVYAYENGQVDINLEGKMIQIQDVVITAEAGYNVQSIKTGEERVSIKTLKQMPSAIGEVDIIKSTLLLPGVKTVGEGAGGFNVRGGNTDQNLVLIDDSPVFNTSHFFGFYSVFNSEIINNFNLYKSSIPASYGGRLSSVLDISTKNGNIKQISGSGGISPITAKFLVEGPIVKEKISFIFGARNTYSNFFLKKIEAFNFSNSNVTFGDVNFKLSGEINKKNSFYFSNYGSRDVYQLNSDTSYNYTNINSSLMWKHLFSAKLYAKFTAVYSKYNFGIESEKDVQRAFKMNYFIDYKEFKTDFTYFRNENHKITYGAGAIYYNLSPGTITPLSDSSLVVPKTISNEKALELAVYLNDEIKINYNLSFDIGIRYSGFINLGPALIYTYKENVPKNITSRIDSTLYGNNEYIGKYTTPEYRFSGRYRINDRSSLKFGYSKMSQYLHMLSNTTAISPTDVWKLSNPNIKPGISHQVSLGFYKNFKNNTIEASVETYYKKTNNLIEYKPGTELLLNENIETDLLSGIGKAYGIEFLVKKKYGKINGWASYTYSRSLIKVDGTYLEEKINDGEFYPTNYDKPHDFTIVANYMFSRIINFSGIVTYSTGRPITYPIAKYVYKDKELVHYSNRNEYRVPDYFRVDLSMNIEGNLRSNNIAHSSWSVSIYNLLSRKNVYSIYFINNNNSIKGYKLSVFARAIPTITYNFRF
jgi:hypothetical protein